MGDFAAPAAANGSSICINSNMSGAVGGNGGGSNGSSVAVPKHSTVVERLRQRIEGCRRHHVSCEARYQRAQAEQLELERRETASLYQRTLEQRSKKSNSSSTGGSKQSKQQESECASTAEQRNNTLIAALLLFCFLWAPACGEEETDTPGSPLPAVHLELREVVSVSQAPISRSV